MNLPPSSLPILPVCVVTEHQVELPASRSKLPLAIYFARASQVAKLLKKICLPVQETQELGVWFLGNEDPLEEEMATDSSILAWEIPWTEEPDVLQSMGLQRVG